MVQICKRANNDEIAQELGKLIINTQDKALEKESVFYLAISGGSLIKTLKNCLIDDAKYTSLIKWTQWKIYFVDERITPLDNPDSNYGAFKTAVLDHLPKDKQPQVYTIDESLISDKQKVADHYESLLPKVPFDLLLLGCGPDGHTCSLFPNATHKYLLEEKNRKIMWCHHSPKPPSDRITVTLPVLESAKHIAFDAEGASKEDIMHQIFDLKDTTLPTALVNKLCDGNVTWFVDDAAFTKVDSKLNFV